MTIYLDTDLLEWAAWGFYLPGEEYYVGDEPDVVPDGKIVIMISPDSFLREKDPVPDVSAFDSDARELEKPVTARKFAENAAYVFYTGDYPPSSTNPG